MITLGVKGTFYPHTADITYSKVKVSQATCGREFSSNIQMHRQDFGFLEVTSIHILFPF